MSELLFYYYLLFKTPAPNLYMVWSLFWTDCVEIFGDQTKEPGSKKSDILALIYVMRGCGGVYPDNRIGAENVLRADPFVGNHTRLAIKSLFF